MTLVKHNGKTQSFWDSEPHVLVELGFIDGENSISSSAL